MCANVKKSRNNKIKIQKLFESLIVQHLRVVAQLWELLQLSLCAEFHLTLR